VVTTVVERLLDVTQNGTFHRCLKLVFGWEDLDRTIEQSVMEYTLSMVSDIISGG
jgi:hypothetical protein